MMGEGSEDKMNQCKLKCQKQLETTVYCIDSHSPTCRNEHDVCMHDTIGKEVV